mmetsp:Transcript_35327/g.71576  ORF Transcript_35327/g.71576 Transcript_35327/m.71576 type:complete len:392 (-) Transcript_35327:357-1532(-)
MSTSTSRGRCTDPPGDATCTSSRSFAPVAFATHATDGGGGARSAYHSTKEATGTEFSAVMYPRGAACPGRHPTDGTTAVAAVAEMNRHLASICKAMGYIATRSHDPGRTSVAAGIRETSAESRYVRPASLRSPAYIRVDEWDVLLLSSGAFVSPAGEDDENRSTRCSFVALSYAAKARRRSIDRISSWIDSGDDADACGGIWLDLVNPGHESAGPWSYPLSSPFASLKVYSVAPVCSWTGCRGCWNDARAGGGGAAAPARRRHRLCLAQFMRAWQWLERELALHRGCLVHDGWSSAVLSEAETAPLDDVNVLMREAYAEFLAQRSRFHEGHRLTPAEAVGAVSRSLGSSWFLKADVADEDARATAANILAGPVPTSTRAAPDGRKLNGGIE